MILRSIIVLIAFGGLLVTSGCFYNPKSMRTVSILDILPDDPCPRGAMYSYLVDRPCPYGQGSPISSWNANSVVAGTNMCPLLLATKNGNAKAIEELLAKGAKPALCADYPSSFYKSAINRVCESNPYPFEPVLALLEREGLVNSSMANPLLLLSAKNVCIPGIRLALRLGADPNTTDEGSTALHLVTGIASDRVIDAVQILVAAGANPDLPGPDGESALNSARRRLGDVSNWPRLKAALLSNKKTP